MITNLRIHIRTLAAESKITRQTERRVTQSCRELRLRARLENADLKPMQIRRIMARSQVSAKKKRQLNAAWHGDLPQYSDLEKQIRDGWIDRGDDLRIDLHRRRTADVTDQLGVKFDRSLRAQSRAALLAYGFLRGKTFQSMEQKSYTPPPWMMVQDMVARYGEGDTRELMQSFSQWRSVVWKHPHLKDSTAAS